MTTRRPRDRTVQLYCDECGWYTEDELPPVIRLQGRDAICAWAVRERGWELLPDAILCPDCAELPDEDDDTDDTDVRNPVA
ncbi:hypothetical protein ABN034_34230 [Actinopolymorpha sp. B11F2]|uniref:hypothetical protein n=1 Tax=Actinopolymorpha sp. B11F2 TaxID=3160862 RepID=UPI0032E3F950